MIDTVPLRKRALDALLGSSRVAGMIVTNSNHRRATTQFGQQFSVPIFAQCESFPDEEPSRLSTIDDGDEICDQLRVIGVAGGPPGEIALYYSVDGGTLIIGDALINFDPYGFTFLPAKYCSNRKQMRRSLRKLLDYKVKRILFAHGAPILSAASERLRALLNSGSD